MNIKKEVIERVRTLLIEELMRCNDKLHDNKYRFRQLTEEQTILKRERVVLTNMINDL